MYSHYVKVEIEDRGLDDILERKNRKSAFLIGRLVVDSPHIVSNLAELGSRDLIAVFNSPGDLPKAWTERVTRTDLTGSHAVMTWCHVLRAQLNSTKVMVFAVLYTLKAWGVDCR